MKTKVIFRVFKGDVIALFPEILGDMNPYQTCLSYMHVGQHGAASVRLKARPASPDEYKELFKELESLGYDLRIVKRFNRKDFEKRRAACL